MSYRRGVMVGAVAIVLTIVAASEAVFAQVPSRVRHEPETQRADRWLTGLWPGATVRVELVVSGAATGRVVSVQPDGLSLFLAHRERTFAKSEIGRVVLLQRRTR